MRVNTVALTGARRLELRETSYAPGPAAGFLEVEPYLGSICGSDKPVFLQGPQRGVPEHGRPMHELLCHVVEDDERVPGRRCIAVPRGLDGMRQRLRVPGVHAWDIQAPVAELSDARALHAQPLATVMAALHQVGDLAGADVLVLGLGTIGQLFARLAHEAGAASVTGYDPVRTAATAGLRQAPGTDCLGRDFDVCIEAVGHQGFALKEALRVCRDWGRILMFGIPPEGPHEIDLHDFMQRRLTLTSSIHPDWSRWLPAAEAYLVSPRGRDLDLTTQRFPVDEAQSAYEAAVDDPSALKVLIGFEAWPSPFSR